MSSWNRRKSPQNSANVRMAIQLLFPNAVPFSRRPKIAFVKKVFSFGISAFSIRIFIWRQVGTFSNPLSLSFR